jgi:hypothetical protein
MASASLYVSCAQSKTIGPPAQTPPVAPNCGGLAVVSTIQKGMCLHLGLNHDVYELVLTLSDLNDFLDQSCAKPTLKIRDAV